jgi:4-carboxymuconolactone decarboxylase
MVDLGDALRGVVDNDDAFIFSPPWPDGHAPVLDPKTLALVRIAALVALGGSLASYVSRVDAALTADATPEEVVGVVVGIATDVGRVRALAASSSIGPVLGFDV